MSYFVYALTDPVADAIRYIGITDNMYARFKQHISNTKSNPDKVAWIQGLLLDTLIPGLKIIEIVDTFEQAIEREKYWVHFYLDNGVELNNVAIANRYREKDDPIPKNRLRYWRIKKCYSQHALGEAVGVQSQTIANYEASKHRIRLNVLQKIAAVLNVPVEQLLEEEHSALIAS